MAEHFLTKTQIEMGQCLEAGDDLALDQFDKLHRILSDRASERAASLFAEPLINRGNDEAPASIAWYTEIEGSGRRLNELDDGERTQAEAILFEELRSVRDLLDDPEIGPLVGAALHLGADRKGDIWVINGRPVITNWGMLPSGSAHDQSSRNRHFASGLGKYLPIGAAPAITAAGVAAALAAKPSQAAATASVSDTSSSTSAAAVETGTVASQAKPAKTPREPRRISTIAWLPLLILLLLAGGTLAWLLMPGTRIFPYQENDPAIAATEAAQNIAAINEQLVARRDALQIALDGAQCRIDGTLLMPDGLTVEGLLPIDPNNPNDAPGAPATGSPTPMLTPDPARVQVPESGGAESGSLLDLVEARTVRVVARLGDEGANTGSGFFVAPDFVLTNYHVVSSAGATEVFVINESIARPLTAEIVARSGPIGENGDDFALLRIPDANQPYYRILNTSSSLKLQSVIAAGYPEDLDFAGGSPDALTHARPLTLTDGTISNQQILSTQPSNSFQAIAHSAPISQGNSGGPLVDMCGRVVGINTFVRQGKLRTINFAVGAKDLLEFLANTPIAPDVVTRPCTPEMLRPVAPSAAGQSSELPTFNLPTGGSE